MKLSISVNESFSSDDSVRGKRERVCALALADHVGHVGKAAAALRLAAGGAMNRGGAVDRASAIGEDFAHLPVVQCIADTDEQGTLLLSACKGEHVRAARLMQLRVVSKLSISPKDFWRISANRVLATRDRLPTVLPRLTPGGPRGGKRVSLFGQPVVPLLAARKMLHPDYQWPDFKPMSALILLRRNMINLATALLADFPEQVRIRPKPVSNLQYRRPM